MLKQRDFFVNNETISNSWTLWLSVFWLCVFWTGSSDDVMDKCGVEEQKVSPQRSNTTVHVCWHRNTSLSMEDSLRATHNSLSGYLLRKFKNSNGWQKLWVVFTNFCLFFYKTFQVCEELFVYLRVWKICWFICCTFC